MPETQQQQFDGQTPVAGYTLFHGKDGQNFYLKGENLADDEVKQRVTKLRGQAAPASQDTRQPSLLEQGRAAYDAEKTHGMPGSFEGHPENVGEYVPATAGNVASGVKDISQGNVARGTHKVISGAGNAFLPALPFVAAAGPAAFAKVAAMGAGGSYLGSNVAEGIGATPDQADVAGDVGGLAGGVFGPKALTATKGAIGDALRTPYGPTSGASALGPGAKAVSSIGKYVGGPELADWMVPERSAGPTGPYSRLPGRLPTALRGDPFSPEVPVAEPELGSPENPGWMSRIPTRMPRQAVVTAPKPSPFGSATPTNTPIGRAELPSVPQGNATPFPLVQKGGGVAPEQVSVFPEPREPLPGDRPGAMWSVGREELPAAATRGVPGATDVLRNLNKPIILTPRGGVGYPGPRADLQGNALPFAPALPETTGDPFSPNFKGGINTQGLEASTKPISNSRMIDSLSSEIDTMKTKLRNSGAASSVEKGALQNQINEYQAHLDAIRRSEIH